MKIEVELGERYYFFYHLAKSLKTGVDLPTSLTRCANRFREGHPLRQYCGVAVQELARSGFDGFFNSFDGFVYFPMFPRYSERKINSFHGGVPIFSPTEPGLICPPTQPGEVVMPYRIHFIGSLEYIAHMLSYRDKMGEQNPVSDLRAIGLYLRMFPDFLDSQTLWMDVAGLCESGTIINYYRWNRGLEESELLAKFKSGIPNPPSFSEFLCEAFGFYSAKIEAGEKVSNIIPGDLDKQRIWIGVALEIINATE
ncbi:MAG: hypothetical protein KKC75_05755 [Nanoarchaeota archaeon]|nr:hypothetical protein [Nanoarchaeota archaeon]MBU1004919.1 hypothetical protein [Nanoarchaeota archaeon]MBU1945635.1 hypothetical protein [Nanoarchaeota archaeon]